MFENIPIDFSRSSEKVTMTTYHKGPVWKETIQIHDCYYYIQLRTAFFPGIAAGKKIAIIISGWQKV